MSVSKYGRPSLIGKVCDECGQGEEHPIRDRLSWYIVSDLERTTEKGTTAYFGTVHPACYDESRNRRDGIDKQDAASLHEYSFKCYMLGFNSL